MINRVLLSGLFVFVVAALAWGNSVTGSISGSVTDSSGAVVPGVEVLAKCIETGIEHSTQTNADGFYSFPLLPLGHYDVKVTGRGFKEYMETGLVIDVNSALRVDATLQVGAVTQQVSVTANLVQVETTSTQMGEVIGTTKVTGIPLNGRSYTDLLALQPGVVPTSTETSGSGPNSISNNVSGDLNPGNLSISGQRETSNGFMVNGGSVQERLYNGTAVIPDLDSIAEFRILTNNADAEYGNFSGGLINVITKSGTNAIHGSAFEFLRNPNLDSRNFFSPSRAVLHQNQFGGTTGGPIRRDKVFFFADFQGTRLVEGVDSGLITLPSSADRTGNLSDLASSLTGSVNGQSWANTLQQELGYPVTPGEPYYSSGCATSSECVFPNAQIPSSVFTAPSNFLLKYIPAPDYGPNVFTSSAYKETLADNKGSGRVDANTRLGLLTGYYYIDDYVQVNPYGGASVPGFSTTNNGRNSVVNVSLTKSFGPSSVNELRLSYLRNVVFNGFPVGGVGPTLASQGFTNIYPMQPNLQRVMSVTFNNFTVGSSPGDIRVFANTYQLQENFSKIVGKHTIKTGGTYQYNQVTFHNDYFFNGAFTFNGTETGVDFADFLIGAPFTYVQANHLAAFNRNRYYGVYGQDSWRAKPNLTLNYGLRWEVVPPWWEAHNELEELIPGEQSIVFPGAPTGYLFPGDPGVPSTLAPTRYNNFAPRAGLAYSPETDSGFLHKILGASGQTSIRAAWGMYYNSSEDWASTQEDGDAPFGFYYDAPAPPQFANPYVDRASGLNRGQRFPDVLPPLNVSPKNPDNSINWSLLEPISSSPGFFTGNRVPYAEDYNISLERQFGPSTMLSVSYVGTQGHRLLSTVEANPGNPALCLSLSQPDEVTNGTTCGPNGELGTYYPITGGVINTTRTRFNADFGGDGWFDAEANSSYNALQVSLRHSRGRSEFLVGYTYSKTMDNSSGEGQGQGDNLNPLNQKITKALSAFDIAHNFVVSYNYQVPFEKLWRPNRLTSGWMLSGVTRFATGFPVYILEPDDRSLLGTGSSGEGNFVDTPTFTPGNLNITNPRKEVLPSSANPTGSNPYFNASLFSEEPLGQLGTSSRRFFTGPGFNNWDMALVKDLRLTESKSLQFRAEFFNVFNHAQFLAPQGNFLNTDFGFVTAASPARIGQVAVRFSF